MDEDGTGWKHLGEIDVTDGEILVQIGPCGQGYAGGKFVFADAIRIEIFLPDSLGGAVLVDEEECIDNWSFEHEVGDDSSNQATYRVEARNAEGAGSRFSDDSMMVSIEVTITAITKGSLGGTGVNEDDELYFAFYSYWLGYDGQVTEVVDEEE